MSILDPKAALRALTLSLLFSAGTPVPLYAQSGDPVLNTLSEGVSLMQQGKLDSALNRFNTVLVMDPENAEAHFRIGQVYLRNGEGEKGISFIRKATELEPRNVRISLDLAAIYEQTNQLEKAIEEYKRLLSTGSRDKRLQEAEKRLTLATGKTLAQKGELNAALLLFNGLLLENPDDPLVLFNIGAAYLLLNRAEEAEAVFRKLLTQQPSNILARLNLATIYERTGEVPKALDQLKAIMDLNTPGAITRTATEKYHIIRARSNFGSRKWEDALKAFYEVLRVNPKSGEAWFNIGLIQIQLGEIKAAEEAFLKVLEINPGDFSARLNLASFYFDIGRVEDAIKQFQYVIDNDKDGRYRTQASIRLNVVHTSLAEMALKAGDVEASLREYEKALDYYSGNVAAYANRGLIFIQQKEFEKARDEFIEVVRLDPENLRGRVMLATIYEELNQLTKAAEQYEKVMEIGKPEMQEVKVAQQKWKITKAKGLWNDQNLSGAEQVFRDILAEHPDNIEANVYLGFILSSKGKLRPAAKAYQKAVAARPNNHRVRILLARVYEQLELEELAAEEYRRVIFTGGEPAVVDEARERLKIVESRLSGFSNNFGYSFGYDSNANFNNNDPGREVRSDLSFDVLYTHKIKDDLKFHLSVSPSYSTFHFGQFDFLSTNVNYVLRKGTPESNWNVTYGSSRLSGLLTEQTVSDSSSYTVERGLKLFLPAAFGLEPVGFADEPIPTRMSVQFSLRTMESFSGARVESWNPTAAVSLNQGLRWGVNANASLNLAVRRNLEQNTAEQEVAERTNPNTGLPEGETITIKTYDSRDYELNSVGVNLSLDKTLSPGLRGTLVSGVTYFGFINPDSGSELEGNPTKRRSVLLSVGGRLSYQFYKNISFFGSVNWQRNISNLSVSDFTTQSVSESFRNFQSTALGSYDRVAVNGGLQMTF